MKSITSCQGLVVLLSVMMIVSLLVAMGTVLVGMVTVSSLIVCGSGQPV